MSDIEAHIDQIVLADHGHSMFMARCIEPVSAEVAERITRHWKRAWEQRGVRAPGLIVVDSLIEITSLTDDELRLHGLMRIEGGPE